jgi:hypothetical protein
VDQQIRRILRHFVQAVGIIRRPGKLTLPAVSLYDVQLARAETSQGGIAHELSSSFSLLLIAERSNQLVELLSGRKLAYESEQVVGVVRSDPERAPRNRHLIVDEVLARDIFLRSLIARSVLT